MKETVGKGGAVSGESTLPSFALSSVCVCVCVFVLCVCVCVCVRERERERELCSVTYHPIRHFAILNWCVW